MAFIRLSAKEVVRPLIFLSLVSALAIWFGDRVGFEGDDLAIIAGAAHLDWRPIESVYRFNWQPLSYITAHWLFDMESDRYR